VELLAPWQTEICGKSCESVEYVWDSWRGFEM
jgi:hypothetical protein